MSEATLRSIMLVDDQREIRSIVGLALGKIGRFELLACESGEEALARAADFAPDLLLLDMNMPGLDGLETLRRLRGLGVLAPAIFFTSTVGQADIARYRDAGAIGTIAKPFEPLRLGARIRQLWEESLGRPG